MKKMIVVFAVLMLAFAVVIPAAAGNGLGSGNSSGNSNGSGSGKGTASGTGSGTAQKQQGVRGTFAIAGTIAAIGTDTVTVNVVSGNKLVQPYIGAAISVAVSSNTSFVLKDVTATTKIAFTDLKVGQAVSVNGTVTNNVWTALRITVGADLSCLP
jgi:hypothetical protein